MPLPEQPYSERPTSAPLRNVVLRCFPGDDHHTGASKLYEDDGISDDYKQGGFATTGLSYSRDGNEITIRVAPTEGSYHGQVNSRAYTLVLPDTQQGTLQAPANAKLSYDAATATNQIDVPETSIGQETVIKIAAADADPAHVRQKALTHRLNGLLGKPFVQWTDADRAALTPGLSDAVRAIHGVALMAVNQNPYLYGKDVQTGLFRSRRHGAGERHAVVQGVERARHNHPRPTLRLQSGRTRPLARGHDHRARRRPSMALQGK